jgi:hypothetical protein
MHFNPKTIFSASVRYFFWRTAEASSEDDVLWPFETLLAPASVAC